jgi:hypothetical protein
LRKKLVTSARPLDEPAELPVLTIFSAPKAFKGHIGIIQENAIRSWLCLRPRPEIIVFSDEGGTAEIARRLGVRHITAVETNAHGTPLVSDMFSQADSLAADTVLAFVSADVILTQSIVEAAATATRWSHQFLLVAQRHDVDVRERLQFDDGWEHRWAARAIARGKLHSPGAVDLFLYPRGQYNQMPPFAIGRTAYDNWLLWNAVASQIPLIDATSFVTLIHQNHGYSHAATPDVWYGQEARENRKWIQHWTNYYSIAHATWMLGADGRLSRAVGWKYRMARPRQLLSHVFRASRRIRTRMTSWRFARRYGA